MIDEPLEGGPPVESCRPTKARRDGFRVAFGESRYDMSIRQVNESCRATDALDPQQRGPANLLDRKVLDERLIRQRAVVEDAACAPVEGLEVTQPLAGSELRIIDVHHDESRDTPQEHQHSDADTEIAVYQDQPAHGIFRIEGCTSAGRCAVCRDSSRYSHSHPHHGPRSRWMSHTPCQTRFRVAP